MNKAFSVLVTGAKGFLGKHTCLWLRRKGYEVFEFDLGSTEEELSEYVSKADFIIHLAGINRPLKPEEFYDGNANFTKHLIDKILEKGRKTPLIFSSSIQAALDNDYCKSKKQAEDFLFGAGLPVYVYRLANVYGKWCRPNYNSAAATFCHNIAHGLPIEIRDRDYVVHYNFVEDIVFESETSKGSFYHYFDGKDALLGTLAYVFDEKYEELQETMDPDLSATDQLIYLNHELFAMIDGSISLDLLARLLATQLLARGEKHLLDRNRTYFKLLRRIVARGQAAGELRADRTANEIVKAYAMWERALMYDWCLSGGEYSLVAYSDSVTPMFLASYRAPAADT